MTGKEAGSDKDGGKEDAIAPVAQEEIDTSDKEMMPDKEEEKAVCSINITYSHHLKFITHILTHHPGSSVKKKETRFTNKSQLQALLNFTPFLFNKFLVTSYINLFS